jgi:hypothetical protein
MVLMVPIYVYPCFYILDIFIFYFVVRIVLSSDEASNKTVVAKLWRSNELSQRWNVRYVHHY